MTCILSSCRLFPVAYCAEPVTRLRAVGAKVQRVWIPPGAAHFLSGTACQCRFPSVRLAAADWLVFGWSHPLPRSGRESLYISLGCGGAKEGTPRPRLQREGQKGQRGSLERAPPCPTDIVLASRGCSTWDSVPTLVIARSWHLGIGMHRSESAFSGWQGPTGRP